MSNTLLNMVFLYLYSKIFLKYINLYNLEVVVMKKGFTLIEMVVVVAITAILSAVILNKVGKVIRNAKDSKAYFIKSQYQTVYRIAGVENEDGHDIGFQDLVNRVDNQAANELYSSKKSTEFKGAYAAGRAEGIGGYVEVGTNTAGTTIEDGNTPVVLLIIDKENGVIIMDHPYNGKDTRGYEWDGIE